MSDFIKTQLENRNGSPIAPLTMASSVFFGPGYDIYSGSSDVSGSTVSDGQTDGSPVLFVSASGSSRSDMIPVIQGNQYLVEAEVVCQNFYKLFVDANGNAITESGNEIPYTDESDGVLLVAPDNAVYLVINTEYDGVKCTNLKVIHVDTLQHKVEKTDLANISGETASDIAELESLKARGITDIRNEGSGYTMQIESIKEKAYDLDMKECPLRAEYTITPEFSQTPYVNTIHVSIEEYGNSHPKLRYMYIDKVYGDTTERLYESYKTSAVAEITDDIQYGKETFIFHAEKQESVKSVTETATRYLCFIGANSASAATESMATGLTKSLVENIDMDIEISTSNGDYIWFILPKELYIKSMVSSGFEVTLDGTPKEIEVFGYGTYNAYRTLNQLGTATWKLVVRQA